MGDREVLPNESDIASFIDENENIEMTAASTRYLSAILISGKMKKSDAASNVRKIIEKMEKEDYSMSTAVRKEATIRALEYLADRLEKEDSRISMKLIFLFLAAVVVATLLGGIKFTAVLLCVLVLAAANKNFLTKTFGKIIKRS